MNGMFTGLDLISGLIFFGFSATTLLLILGTLLKISGGLFWSRPPQRFKDDQNAPEFETEERLGKAFYHVVFKYVPPFFLGFVLLLFWQLFLRK